MLGRVDLARSQVGAKQVRSTEDVERQEAVVVIVTMEESLFLVPVHAIVRGVEVEDELLGSSAVRLEELFDENLGHPHK